MCRLRNDVFDVLRELLKSISGPQEDEIFEADAAWLVFPCYQQSVSSANTPIVPCQDALPEADAMRCLQIAPVGKGSGSCSKSFAGATIFLSGRSSSMC